MGLYGINLHKSPSILLIFLLNGVCPQSCPGGCPSPSFIQPPQSVVLTLPVPQNRLPISGPAMIAQAPVPCCPPSQVQSVTWLNQPLWTNGIPPGPLPTNPQLYPNPNLQLANPPYLQPSTVRPNGNPQQYTASPQGTPQGTYNYNSVNNGFTTPSPIQSTTPGGSYNQPNQGFSTVGGLPTSTASPQTASYNGLNVGSSGSPPIQQPPQQPFTPSTQSPQPPFSTPPSYNQPNSITPTYPSSYNQPNDGFLQGQNQGGYNGLNVGPNGPTPQGGPNDGEYMSSFEGTFVGPANPQLNGQGNQGNFDQTLGYGQNQNNMPGPFPTQPISGNPNQAQFPQQVNNEGFYQGSANGQQLYNGNEFANAQTQSPFEYNTVHPNPNDQFNPSAQYPVTATANTNMGGVTQSPNNNFQYSTQFNPNGQIQNQQFPSTVGPGGVNVSPLNDPQFQTTPNPNTDSLIGGGAVLGGLAGGGMAGGLLTTTTPFIPNTNRPSSTTSSNSRPTSTPWGQDASGQFVQPSSQSPFGSTTMAPQPSIPTSIVPMIGQAIPLNNNAQQEQQFQQQQQQQFGGFSTQTPVSDGLPLTAQHPDMNFQYSKGVDGGSTLPPQMLGSTQSTFFGNQNQQTTFSPLSSTGSLGMGNRLYDHGDMNTQYGRYDSTRSPDGGLVVGDGMNVNQLNGETVVSRSTEGEEIGITQGLTQGPQRDPSLPINTATTTSLTTTVMALLIFFYFL